MASLGKVVSTALTGEDAPVFQGAPKEVKALAKQAGETSAGVAEVNAKVDALTDAFTKFLESQTVKATPEVAEAPEKEAEKETAKAPAKSTKAKADTKADTKTDTPTKDPEGKLDPADEKVGSVQKGQQYHK